MKKIYDSKRIYQSFINSYDIIMSGKTLEDFLDDMEINFINLDVVFAHDPTTPLTKFELLFLLTYFEEVEDYERCANLDKMLRNAIKNVPKRNK
jgi:hypothetical protein|tara:strand:- start:2506 stop:2787 length:282 start_codon:yes stop_codon:yes gene_type:complete